VSGTPVSSMLLMLLASIIGSFGAVLLKLGAGELNKGFWHILNIKLAAGVAVYLVSWYFFVLGIRHGELSVLYPMVSLATSGRSFGRASSSKRRLPARSSQGWG